MGLIKKIFTLILLCLIMVGIAKFSMGKIMKPHFNVKKNALTISEQEFTSLKTDLKLRLAQELLAAVGSNKSNVDLIVTSAELDLLLKYLLAQVDTNHNLKLLGSSFQVVDQKGQLQLALQVNQQYTVGLTSLISLYHYDDMLIFVIDQTKLGPFELSNHWTHWFLATLAAKPITEHPNLSLAKNQIDFYFDFQDDLLTITHISFTDAKSKQQGLLIEFAVQSDKFHQQILQQLQEILPPHIITGELTNLYEITGSLSQGST